MYDIVKQLIGTLPTEFEFVYIIVTLVLAMLVISFLFSIFYIPINMLRGK
nr:MAG TPA: Preprotein translocase subunit SecE, Preprotein, archaeal, ribosomal, 50S, protein.0A [Inoviridae sp.]